MVEVAIELIEAVDGRQELVAVAKMIFPDLGRHVPQRPEQFGKGRIIETQALRRTRQSDSGETRAHWELPGDEGGAPGGATGLAVGVGEQYTLAGYAIDVGCTPPHHATVVGTNVEYADIVGHDRQHVGEASDRLSRNRLSLRRRAGAQRKRSH